MYCKWLQIAIRHTYDRLDEIVNLNFYQLMIVINMHSSSEGSSRAKSASMMEPMFHAKSISSGRHPRISF
jgi:hypothetical protein